MEKPTDAHIAAAECNTTVSALFEEHRDADR